MDPNFWLQKWELGETRFHEGQANGLLVEHFDALSLKPDSRVFLPLCGKTRDIHWLLSKGMRVSGAELSVLAIEQLFAELGVTPEITPVGALRRYSADGIDIFVGDIFELTRAALGPVDAIYDRAALVALPQPMRDRYAPHLVEITVRAPQLLICFEYDQSLVDGPPFSIGAAEVDRLYRDTYVLTALETADVPGGLKGICPAQETIWLLR
ncbi:MAG TPA: thiopurine S-methyltransferase [Alphaproteobacteria bacterium]|jgi:thiopurine S-methyltransferase|nr:thiopurine S-methyltransferase [Alphaproteobacteria bacterium]